MPTMLHDLAVWLHTSDLALQIREDDLLFPMIESLHVLCITLVVGSIMVVDLRLLGLASTRRSITEITGTILPMTWVAFAIAFIAGGLLFISNAVEYSENGFFIAKMLLMALAGANMLVFHLLLSRNIARWNGWKSPPLAARLSGGLSLGLWVAIVACGRWIGFTMPGS